MLRTDELGRLTHLGDLTLERPDHPLMPAPTRDEFLQMGFEPAVRLIEQRQDALIKEASDPYRYGWEPPVWKLTDAICGFPWVDPSFGERVRAKLGLKKPVKKLLLNGGQRSAKTTYCARRTLKMLLARPGRRAWMFHDNSQMSIDYHHKLVWEQLPLELRREAKTATEYIGYKQQIGFSGDKVTFANLSDLGFRNYSQDKTSIEGGELDIIVADELCPLEWSRTFDFRVSTRDGWVLHPFTPVNGYSPLVAEMRGEATCVLDSAGWLLPLDARGEPDHRRAVELRNVLADALRESPPEPPEAAKYHRVPRVERCKADRRAVVFFHSSDNPYGNPERVKDDCLSDGRADFIRERFYGEAVRSVSAKFNFDEKVHVVPPGAVPPGGTAIMITDPASSRNWFMLWMKFVGADAYVYREWPTLWRPVRDHGHLGEWAVRSGNKPDGKKGPGQDSLGWGLLRYKEEIALLEGWHDAKPDSPLGRNVAAWSEGNGSRERIMRRIMDSRFASAPKLEHDRPETVLTQFEDIGMWFDTASGADVEDGLQRIIELLYYDRTRPVDATNRPRLFISAECPNVIHAMKTYVGLNPETGKTDFNSPLKDIVDNLRYGLTCGVGDVSAADARAASRPRSTGRHY